MVDEMVAQPLEEVVNEPAVALMADDDQVGVLPPGHIEESVDRVGVNDDHPVGNPGLPQHHAVVLFHQTPQVALAPRPGEHPQTGGRRHRRLSDERPSGSMDSEDLAPLANRLGRPPQCGRSPRGTVDADDHTLEIHTSPSRAARTRGDHGGSALQPSRGRRRLHTSGLPAL
jgi:hypothetical protein